jgi:8-oxo-dGTP diphosphatase
MFPNVALVPETGEFRLPPIALSVDAVIFTVRDGGAMVALVRRANPPYLGEWALPGGFVEVDEDLPEAAARELAEETGLEVPTSMLNQLGAYGAPGRDPRMRVVSVVFWAIVPDLADPVGGSDAASAAWLEVAEARSDHFELAFDHDRILADAVEVAGIG